MKAQMTTVEKWYAIKAHAEAIVKYAERQTDYGKKPEDDVNRVAYWAKRIEAVASLIAGSE